MKLLNREKRAREISHEDIAALKRTTRGNKSKENGNDARQSPSSLCRQQQQQQQDAGQQLQKEQRIMEGYRLSRWQKESLAFPVNEESRVVNTETAVCSSNAGGNAGGCCTLQDRRTPEEGAGTQATSSLSLGLKQLLLGYVLQDAMRRRNEAGSSNHHGQLEMAWSILLNLRPQPEDGSSFTSHWLQAVMTVSEAMTPMNMQLHDTTTRINTEEESISDLTDDFSTSSSISTLTTSD